MCCEDVEIGRHSPGQMFPVDLETTTTEVLGADPARTVLVLGSALTGNTTYALGRDAVLGVGINLAAMERPVILTLKEHGNLMTLSVHVIHSVGSIQAAVAIGQLEDGICRDSRGS